MKKPAQTLLRRFLIELAIYSVLVFIYLVLVLRTLSDNLAQLYAGNPVAYAVGGLLLIIVQGLALEMVTSYLLERLGLE